MESKIKDKVSREKEYDGKNIEVKIPITALIFEKYSAEERISVPVEISYKYTTKTGKERIKKNKMGLLASYCPFCGKKIEEE